MDRSFPDRSHLEHEIGRSVDGPMRIDGESHTLGDEVQLIEPR